jgi:hypothetical protein
MKHLANLKPPGRSKKQEGKTAAPAKDKETTIK